MLVGGYCMRKRRQSVQLPQGNRLKHSYPGLAVRVAREAVYGPNDPITGTISGSYKMSSDFSTPAIGFYQGERTSMDNDIRGISEHKVRDRYRCDNSVYHGNKRT